MTPRRGFLHGLIALPFVAGCRARTGASTGLAQAPETLRVMTLNLAHGRGRAFTQTNARRADWYRHNLDIVAQVLRRERPAIVALQEAELGSRWAGSFDHVRYLAQHSGMPYLHATPHMDEPPRFRYGTALLSRHPLHAPSGGTFTSNGRWRKGWTQASVATPHGRFHTVSVHLDFASASRRALQVGELAQTLGHVQEPLIVMGDLNSTWQASDRSAVDRLAHALGLRTFAIDRNQAPTFGRRRIDWILVTPPIAFAQRHALTQDVLSDHRAVIIDLVVAG
jgi:endonuclease/exonuclease/phosphatase family metal-dependent hydrolase